MPCWRRIGVGLLLVAIPAFADGPGVVELDDHRAPWLLVDAGSRRA